jgi:hypothetical protein
MIIKPHPQAELKKYGELELWEWHAEGIRNLELTGVGVMPDYEADALAGKFVDDAHYELIVVEDCDIYKPRGNDVLAMFDGESSSEDRLLISFRKGVVPIEQAQEAGKILKSAASKSDNRGLAAGPVDVRKLRSNAQGGNLVQIGNRTTRVRYELPDGSIGTTDVANKVRSGIAGNFDATPRHPFCRETSWSRSHPGKTERVHPFLESIDACFQSQAPVRWQRQKDFVEEHDITGNGWCLGNTVFTTLTVNHSFRTACHKDAGDFPGGYGNLTVCEFRPYKGGYTGLVQYKIAVDVRMGDFLAMDVHEWHANTEVFPLEAPPEGEEWDDLWNKGFDRISFVCYARFHMKRCKSQEEELAIHQEWYSKFLPPKDHAVANEEGRVVEAAMAETEMAVLQSMLAAEEDDYGSAT